MESGSSCYCCPQPAVAGTSAARSDLDAALGELGMLSAVTDSRLQYKQELKSRRCVFNPRGRNLSEPGLSGAGTPSNSPTKGGGVYQIVQLNSQFVTSLTSGLDACSRTKPEPSSTARECLDFGEKYKQEELEQDARANRISRLKIARIKRYRRPYELPWRHHLEQTYNNPFSANERSLIYNVNQLAAVQSPFMDKTLVLPSTKIVNSNSSTPEKNPRAINGLRVQQQTVSRSKSLDDLDLSKLQLAETENRNFRQEKQEIDTVSEHLQGLHVQE